MAREKIRDAGPLKIVSPEEQKKAREKEAAERNAAGKVQRRIEDEEVKVCATIRLRNEHNCAKCAACDVRPGGGYCKSAVARAAFEDWSGVMVVPALVGCMYWRAK